MILNILVTGGTGSFGQKCIKKLCAQAGWGKIIVYSRDEHKQEAMQQHFIDDRLRFFIGDIRDKDRLQLATEEATHIIHAAALKIVPAAEYNPFEYVKTNILGTQNLIDCCLNHPLSRQNYPKVIGLSTDKAVSPINLYGATKLTMEKMLLAANNIRGEVGPTFNIVRYGNVANSNGSVIKIFQKHFLQKKPIPVTDRRMTRFWITLDDAVDFVLSKISTDETGKVYIPEMPSFKIVDLASCFSGNQILIGIRPGEKLHEEIEPGRASNDNTVWLSENDLRQKLILMGVL